jgi:A/G-specific adenine glycosylase
VNPLPDIAGRVVAWQRSHGRHALPWQNTRDPYRVWLSEIMLQQTQVSTVLAYYERFLQRFPDLQSLAAAPVDDVLALWSGLGYYSRARNLLRCAQAVIAEHGGAFPRSSAQLAQLPGIGRSTAAAIAAFCFGERAAILDGNVKRVLARALGFGGDLAQAAQERELWRQAEALLPAQGIEAYTQGLMDLGAGVCLVKRPQCLLCPLNDVCAARREGAPERYPVKTRKLKRGRRENALLWLERDDAALWLTQRPDTGVWAGLWSLPEFPDLQALQQLTQAWPGESQALDAFEHVLTHFDWRLLPVRHRLPATSGQALSRIEEVLPGGRWVAPSQALQLGLPAPIRRLLQAST